MRLNYHGSNPSRWTQFHDQVIESFPLGLFLQFVLLIWGFGQITLTLFESANQMLGWLFGENVKHV